MERGIEPFIISPQTEAVCQHRSADIRDWNLTALENGAWIVTMEIVELQTEDLWITYIMVILGICKV